MRWTKFRQSITDAQIVFVHDSVKNGHIDGLLRALPAILYSGFDDVTCPKRFLKIGDSRRHQLSDYTWHLLQDIDGRDFDLVASTTQYYEDRLGRYTLRTLLKRYSKSDRRLVVIGNRPSFIIAGMVRPLREDPIVDKAFAYDDIYDAFKEHYESNGFSLPLKGTKNLFLQDNALIYGLATGEQLSTIEDLVDVLPRAPYLPIVRRLSTIFMAEDLGSEPLESTEAIEEFGKWIRRRMELDFQEALSIARTINDYASTNERLFDEASRRRMPAMSIARDGLSSLDDQTDPIAERYRRWLSEGL